jgi:hypothetical protein
MNDRCVHAGHHAVAKQTCTHMCRDSVGASVACNPVCGATRQFLSGNDDVVSIEALHMARCCRCLNVRCMHRCKEYKDFTFLA